MPKWEASDWKTHENMSVKTRLVLEKMKAALEPLEVIWQHIPEHQGILSNEMADTLARENIKGLANIEGIGPDLPPESIIIQKPPTTISSEDDDDAIETSDHPLSPSKSNFKEGLQRSFA